MKNKLTPMLVRVDFDIVKDPFDPGSDYSKARRFEENDKRILQTVESRFPPQPNFPEKSKILSTYFLVEMAIKGDMVLGRMNRLENQYFDTLRERSLAYDISRRVSRRQGVMDENIRRGQREDDIKTREKYRFLYQRISENKLNQREAFLIINAKTWLDRLPQMKLRSERRDDESRLSADRYAVAMLKGLEDIPKEMVVTGGSIQQVLNELSDSSGSSVMTARARISENILKMYAEQINDHVKQQIPNFVLYAASVELPGAQVTSSTSTPSILAGLDVNSPASVFGTLGLIEENIDRAHADQVNDHMAPDANGPIGIYAGAGDFRIDSEIRVELRQELENEQNSQDLFLEQAKNKSENHTVNSALTNRAIENQRAYWNVFDENHAKIIKTISTSGLNAISTLSNMVDVGPGTVNYMLQRIKTNLEHAHADNIAPSSWDSIPNSILFHRSNKKPEFPTAEMIQSTKNKHEVDSKRLTQEKREEFDGFRDTNLEIRYERDGQESLVRNIYREQDHLKEEWYSKQGLKSSAAREKNWELYDQIHQHTPRTISITTANSNTLLRELPYQSPAKVNYILTSSNLELASANDEQARDLKNLPRISLENAIDIEPRFQGNRDRGGESQKNSSSIITDSIDSRKSDETVKDDVESSLQRGNQGEGANVNPSSRRRK